MKYRRAENSGRGENVHKYGLFIYQRCFIMVFGTNLGVELCLQYMFTTIGFTVSNVLVFTMV